MAETTHHKALKQIVQDTALSEGWDAATEVSGASATGKRWRADVVAKSGARRIAFELQWSGQAHANFDQRAVPYRESGIEVVWVHRSTRFAVTRDVVEARVSYDEARGYLASLPGAWDQVLPLTEYIRAVLTGRLSYGLPKGAFANLAVYAADAKCWFESCDGTYQVIPFVTCSFGNPLYPTSVVKISLAEIGRVPEFERCLLLELEGLPIRQLIRHRHSRTLGESYLSTGCPKCDRIAGDHFMHNYAYDANALIKFKLPLPEAMTTSLFDDYGRPDKWLVV